MSLLASPKEVQFNFRKLRQDFSSGTLKEGKRLYEKKENCTARIVSCTASSFLIEASVTGLFSDKHVCQLEIDRNHSSIILSHCDCSNQVDCLHIACALYYIEESFHRMLLQFLEGESTEASTTTKKQKVIDQGLKEAKKASEKKIQHEQEKITVKEFIDAATLLAQSSLLTKREVVAQSADLFINIGPLQTGPRKLTEISFAVKLPDKVKPVAILQPKLFFQSMIQEEALFLGSSFTLVSFQSFGQEASHLLETLSHAMEFIDRADRVGKASYISQEMVDCVMMECARLHLQNNKNIHLFSESFEKPYVIHSEPINLEFFLSLIQEPSERILVQAKVLLPQESVSIRAVRLLRSSMMGCLKENDLYLFPPTLHPKAKEELESLDTIVIPPSLFGSFFTCSLPELQNLGLVHMTKEVESKSKTPFQKMQPRLSLHLDLQESLLTARGEFLYGESCFPEIRSCKKLNDIGCGHEKQQLLARDIFQEVRLIQKTLWGFSFDEKVGQYTTASERKISEFFIETLAPQLASIDLHLGSNLRPFVSRDHSQFALSMEYKGSSKVLCKLKVKGVLKGASLAKVLESGRLRRSALEIDIGGRSASWSKKYILLGFRSIELLCHAIEEAMIPCLDDCEWEIPLWVALGLDEKKYESIGFTIAIQDTIQEIKKNLTNPLKSVHDEIDIHPSCTVKGYQKEGIQWLRHLKAYFLGGILADDMGLGKTLQTIGILSEIHLKDKAERPSLIVCPTSLVENWILEIEKFQPNLKATTLCGSPQERKKIIEESTSHHIFIASYGLVQRDIDFLSQLKFSYVILDEGQAIKNKETYTARAVKQLEGHYKLVLTGTPIENSLEDLWSLFDFLMPSFLGSYDKFCHHYLKVQEESKELALEGLKKKVKPFILRRMKHEVLHDLPSITHTRLHCTLLNTQAELYKTWTA